MNLLGLIVLTISSIGASYAAWTHGARDFRRSPRRRNTEDRPT